MRYLRLMVQFVRASFLEDAAYRANFWINLLYSVLNLAGGVLGLSVVFGQVKVVQGWDFSAALAVLGVYLIVSALRGLFIGPGLESLAGMDGEVWTGNFDFTILRPVNTQFLVSLRKWHLFSLFDLLLGCVVLGSAAQQMGAGIGFVRLAGFFLALLAGVLILYAILLAFAALVFLSPGVLFTWIFDGLFQMSRFPTAIYPGWLRLALTWVVPVGIITTLPAQALTGTLPAGGLLGGLALAAAFTVGASALFQRGLRRYASASS